jgi:arylsulfatase A-like enzyme
MPVQNVICISIDGLRASALGAYGNTWHGTPAMDALAARSYVFEWMLCDRPTLSGFFESVWRLASPPSQGGARGGISGETGASKATGTLGEGPSPNLSPEGRGTLAELVTAYGVATSLVTDDRQVADLAEVGGFAEIRRIDFSSSQLATAIADTELAQLFAVAIDQLAGWAEAAAVDAPSAARRLLWLHARGYRGTWDAPAEYRDSLLDDEDPPAPSFIVPPALEAVSDHDQLLQFRAAYAAQTLVLDECLAALAGAIDEFGLEASAMVVLIGTRGFALGEHGVVGTDAGALYSELLHVPCLVRMPGADSPPPRVASLRQPGELYQLVIDLLGISTDPAASGGALREPFDAMTSRPYVVAKGEDGEFAIRTPAWMLRRPRAVANLSAEAGESIAVETAELYRKPDDRWEANEVASLMPEVTSRLLAVVEGVAIGDPARMAVPLDDDLVIHSR